MSETQTEEAPPPAAEHAPPAPTGFKLAPRRAAIKVGMPTDGMWLFAGLPKAGKTSLAASIPDAVILELEKHGADRIDGWVQEIPDLPTFRQAILAVLKEPAVKTVVIDTLDVLVDWIEDDVAAQYGLENMSERKEGTNGFAVWGELRKRINGLVGTFKGCGKLVVLLAHFKEPKLDNEGRLVVTQNINAPGKIGSYICAQADAIGNCYKQPLGQGTQYVVSFQGGGVTGAFGSRIAELEDKRIILPKGKQWAAIEAAFKPEAPKEAAAVAADRPVATKKPAPAPARRK